MSTLVPHAASASSAVDSLPAPARAAVGRVQGLEASLRSKVGATSFVGRTAGVLAAGGGPVPVAPSLPPPTAADLAAAQSSRPALTAPLAGLLAAVRQARDLLGPLSPSDVDGAMAAVTHDFATWPQRLRQAAPAPGGDALAAVLAAARPAAPASATPVAPLVTPP